jgi:hypothetical protein
MRTDSEISSKRLFKFRDKFSVILPVYKKNNYLEFKKSLASITNQIVTPSEIIIIYDGPVSFKIKVYVEKMTKQFPEIIKVLTNANNVGLGKTLSKAVRVSKYNIIARMDADDSSNKYRFFHQLKFIKKNNFDVVGANLEEIYNKKKKIRSNPVSDYYIKKYLYFRNPFNHQSVMFRKQAVIKAGNYENVPYYEDYYLWVKMSLSKSKFGNINKSLVTTTVSNDFFLRRTNFKYFKNYFNFLLKCKKIKFYNNIEILLLSIIRTPVFLLPKAIIKILYFRFLRKSFI